MNQSCLRGRRALVTGASSGIGRHLARSLATAGAAVAVTARRLERLVELTDAINASGGRAIALQMDVTRRKSVEAGVASVERQLGGIDILINNAGAARTSPFLDMTEADWGTVIETCLSGVWRVGQVVARKMVARRCGSIINIASVAGLAVQSNQANYSAAKAGVLHLTRVMAYELARHNVRVNAIAPGYFGTEMNADFVGSVAGRKYIERLVPGRLGELGELDGPVLLLASAAGKFITGTVLPIDGGTLLKGL